MASAAVFALAGCGSGDDGAQAAGGKASDGKATTVTVAGRTVKTDPSIRSRFPSSIVDSGQLRLALFVPLPPFIMHTTPGSDELAGLIIDLGHAVAALAGVKPSFQVYDAASAIPAVQGGKADVVWLPLVPTAERLKVLDFVVFMRNAYGILLPKDNPKHVQSVEDLCGSQVAILESAEPVKAIVADRQAACKAANKPPIKSRTFPSEDTVQLAVKTGQVDAQIDIGSTTQYVAKTAEGGTAFTSVLDPRGLGGKQYLEDAVGFMNDAPELRDAVQAALQKLIDDGTYGAIMKKYGVDNLGMSKAAVRK